MTTKSEGTTANIKGSPPPHKCITVYYIVPKMADFDKQVNIYVFTGGEQILSCLTSTILNVLDIMYESGSFFFNSLRTDIIQIILILYYMVRSEKTNKVTLVQLYIYINQNSKTTTKIVKIKIIANIYQF